MTTRDELLFVYGTLRRGSGHRMSRLLEDTGEFVDRAFCSGRLYLVARYPGLVDSSNPRDRVLGDVFRMRRSVPLLVKLDRYEGYDPRDPQAPYVRERRPVTLASDETVDAWVYIYRRSTASLEHIPGGDFLLARSSAADGGAVIQASRSFG